jgi:hypothetical protein
LPLRVIVTGEEGSSGQVTGMVHKLGSPSGRRSGRRSLSRSGAGLLTSVRRVGHRQQVARQGGPHILFGLLTCGEMQVTNLPSSVTVTHMSDEGVRDESLGWLECLLVRALYLMNKGKVSELKTI